MVNNRISKLVLVIFSIVAICITLALASKNIAAEFNAPHVDEEWGEAEQISTSEYGAYKPVIRHAPNSNAMLLVYDQQVSETLGDNDPYSAISLDNATTWISTTIASFAGKSDQVKGLLDNSNNAISLWVEHTSIPNEVYTLAYAIKPDVVNNTGNIESDWIKGNIDTFPIIQGQLLRDPNIALDSNNTVHVVWVKQDFAQTYIYYSYRVENNSSFISDTWSDPILIQTPNPGPPLAEPAIAVDSNGKVHIAWQEEPIPGEIEIRYVRGEVSGDGTTFNIDSGRNRIKLSPDAIQEAVLPVLYATDSQLHIVFSNQLNGGEQQNAYYSVCALPCDNLSNSNFRSISGGFVSSHDTDPYLLFTDFGYDSENNSAHIYFHGDDGVATNNNELIMGVTSCNNWLTRDRATEATAYRAIRPSITIKNEVIFLAFDKIVAGGSNDHQIYVQSRPLDCSGSVYLPIITKQ